MICASGRCQVNEEIWLPVRRYEGVYEVSNLGRVRRVLACRGATAGRIIKRHDTGDGYRRVQLCHKDVKRFFGVHVLVAEAFLGARPRGKVPNHKNLNKADNRLDNLEWMTHKQNAAHAVANGRKGGRPMPRTLNGNVRLKESQVSEIKRLQGRVGQRTLAKLCGVSKSAIQKIHQGKLWADGPCIAS